MNKIEHLPNEIDYAGLKFEIMKEMGEDCEILFVKEDNNRNKTFYSIGHEKADGVSSIIKLIEKITNQKVKTFPIARTDNKPNIFKRIILAYTHVKRQTPRKYIFNNQKTAIGKPAAFEYFYFSKEDTNKIELICKANNISINTLLLWAVDKMTQKYFLKGKQERVWMMPVNIRDSISDKYRVGNHATTLSIILNDENQIEINDQIKGQLKSGIIWGGRIVANAPKYIGEKGLRKIAKKAKSPYVGLCSNIGKWPENNHDTNLQDQVIVIAPATSLCPISMAIMTWQDSLTISLQIHPSLLSDNKTEEINFLQNVIDEICHFSKLDHRKITKLSWQEITEKTFL